MNGIKAGQEEMKVFIYDEVYDMYYPRFRDLVRKHVKEIEKLCDEVKNSGKNVFNLDHEVIKRKVIRDLISDWQYHVTDWLLANAELL